MSTHKKSITLRTELHSLMIYEVLRALTLISGLAGKGQNFLTKVLPFFCSQVHITS